MPIKRPLAVEMGVCYDAGAGGKRGKERVVAAGGSR